MGFEAVTNCLYPGSQSQTETSIYLNFKELDLLFSQEREGDIQISGIGVG